MTAPADAPEPLGVWVAVMVVSPGGMVGTGVGCAFVGAALLDIFRGNV